MASLNDKSGTSLWNHPAWRPVFFVSLLVYSVLLWTWVGAYAGGGDSSGYLNSARLLSRGQIFETARGLPEIQGQPAGAYALIPLGLNFTKGEPLVPTYPTGLPLVLAVAGKTLGWEQGPGVVMVSFSLLTVLSLYALARELGASRAWSYFGALALASSPLFIFSGAYLMSDIPSTAWATLSLLAIFKGRRSKGWLLAAGAAFGLGVLTRPSNLVMLPAMAVLLGVDWRRWLAFGCGGAPFGAFFFLYNHAAYGSAFSTGYGFDTSLFQTAVVGATLVHYVVNLPLLLGPFVVLALFAPKAGDRRRLVLGLWILGVLAFYVVYFHTHEAWWYLRFILPAFPAFVVLMVLGLERVFQRVQGHLVLLWAPILACLVLLVWNRQFCRYFKATSIGRGERIYLDSARMAGEKVPSEAVVLCMQSSGALFFYTDLKILRYDQFTPEQAALATASFERSGRPVYALLHDIETARVMRGAWAGRWVKLDHSKHVSLWKLQGAGK